MKPKRKYVVEGELVYLAETRRFMGTLTAVKADGIDVDETVFSPHIGTPRDPKARPVPVDPGQLQGDRLAAQP